MRRYSFKEKKVNQGKLKRNLCFCSLLTHDVTSAHTHSAELGYLENNLRVLVLLPFMGNVNTFRLNFFKQG